MGGTIRSFTSCRASDMDRLFWFSLLLTYLPVTESTKQDDSCLLQPNRSVWKQIGQSVVLKCTVRSDCSAKGLDYKWFTFTQHYHNHLDLKGNPLKYSLDGASLKIKSLHINDSGVYHCAAALRGEPAPGAQHVGMGTTLEVGEHIKTTVRPFLLWITFVLLIIYSLAIVTLIIKKYGSNMIVCRRKFKIKQTSTKKAQFRNVLQEMYSRGNMDGDKNTVSRNQAQATSTEFNSSIDDIYQNV